MLVGTCCPGTDDRDRLDLVFENHSAVVVPMVPEGITRACFKKRMCAIDVSYRVTNRIESSFMHQITQYLSRAKICAWSFE